MADPVIAKKAPAAVEVEQGKSYAWCRCGRSKDQPWCDGSHEGTDFAPLVFRADKTGTVHLCQCKHTKDAPFCDGTHAEL